MRKVSPQLACAGHAAQGLLVRLITFRALPCKMQQHCCACGASMLCLWQLHICVHAAQVMVDSAEGCRQAAQHLAGAGCLGIDAEWEPSMKVASKPQPSIMQACAPKVVYQARLLHSLLAFSLHL